MQNENRQIVTVEVFTGLTLNYPLASPEYRDSYYPVIKKLLELNRKSKLPISATELQELLKPRVIPEKMIGEILNELHYYSVMYKCHYPNQEHKFDFAFA